MGNKDWVEVYFDNEQSFWVPKISDIADILQKIGKVEDVKYGVSDYQGNLQPVIQAQGAGYLAKMIKEAILGKPIPLLIKEYKLPNG